ncbi:MAG: DUF4421 family protein [Cyclobacteriaceae bacterium]
MLDRRILAIVLLMLSGTRLMAAGEDSLRATYIHKYSNHLYLAPLFKQQNFDFDVTSPNDPDLNYLFKANTSVSLGAAVSIFDVNFEAAFSTSLNTKDESIYGSSDARDLQVRVIGKQWIADLFSQNYQGFYLEASNQTIPSGQPLPQRPDMLTKNFGLSFAYAFNHNQFSLRAPYIFTERQKVSKGSWLVGYTFSSFTLSADSSFVPQSEWDTWGKGATIEKARFTSLGFAPGYTHTFVYNKFFLNLLLVFGPAHYWVRYTEQENKVTDDIRIDFYSGGRVGVGYSGDKFFGGINLSTQTKNVNFDESRFRNNTSVFRIVAGMRLREIGILKKGAIDILKGK